MLNVFVGDAFHEMKKKAIPALRKGMVNPDLRQFQLDIART
jgi:hypothetical protein